MSLVNIEPDLQDFVLNLNTVTEAGAPITFVSDNSKWINYPSAIGGGGAYRDVTVQLQGG